MLPLAGRPREILIESTDLDEAPWRRCGVRVGFGLQNGQASADGLRVDSALRPRLSDAYTDTVLAGTQELFELLNRASESFWRQLATTGAVLRAHPDGDLEHCARLAVSTNRAALLIHLLEQLDQVITRSTTNQVNPTGPPGEVEPARLPLAAAVTVMVMGDLLDPDTYTRMLTALDRTRRP